MLRDQFFNYVPKKIKIRSPFLTKFRNTMYVLSLKEFYMDNYIYGYLWFPLKRWGGKVASLNTTKGVALAIVGGALGVYMLSTGNYESFEYKEYLPDLFGLFALLFSLRAFTIRKHTIGAWVLLTLNHFWIALAVSFNEHFNYTEVIFYLSGIVEASIPGFLLLYFLSKKEKFNLDDYYGHAIEHKYYAFGFLLSAIALMGFPITTTFLGEDLLFAHIHEDQIFLMSILALNYVVSGIAIMRIYARVFMGPNHKWYRPEARRSA